MAGKTMFLMRIRPGMEQEFIERWQKEIDALRSQKGFRSRELIRVAQGEGAFVVLSEWDSPEDYQAWRESQTRERIYGGDLSPLFLAPPITGYGEVLIHME